MHIITSMINQTLTLALPIILAGFGGLFSERSGVANIALEGLMMFGAFVTAGVVVSLEGITSMSPWIAILAGAIIGAIISITHAYVSITMRGDQIISATALNFLALGGTVYFCEIIFGQQRTPVFQRGFTKVDVPILKDIPFFGDAFFSNVYQPVYMGVVLIAVVWFVVNKTSFGLRLRATGEHPRAVDSAGVNVYKMRYAGVILSGFFAGLAGGVMVLTQDTQYSVTSIHGTGFIALAALIFGQWKTFGIVGAALFFGFSQILALYSNSIAFLNIFPLEFFKIVPYLFTIVALIAFSRHAIMPRALAVPYEKGSR